MNLGLLRLSLKRSAPIKRIPEYKVFPPSGIEISYKILRSNAMGSNNKPQGKQEAFFTRKTLYGLEIEICPKIAVRLYFLKIYGG
jgi:hypothetical protein